MGTLIPRLLHQNPRLDDGTWGSATSKPEFVLGSPGNTEGSSILQHQRRLTAQAIAKAALPPLPAPIALPPPPPPADEQATRTLLPPGPPPGLPLSKPPGLPSSPANVPPGTVPSKSKPLSSTQVVHPDGQLPQRSANRTMVVRNSASAPTAPKAPAPDTAKCPCQSARPASPEPRALAQGSRKYPPA